MSDVLEHSGAPPGSAYHYFPGGRMRLLEEAVDYAGAYIAGKISAADYAVALLDSLVDDYRRQLIRSDYRAGCPIVAVTVEGRGSRSPRTHHEADRTRRGSIRALGRPGPPTTGGRRCGNAARRGTGDAGDGIHRGRDRRRPSIVLQNTQARAELPAGSRRTIAASRIQLHRAGAVALQAVEHTDPMQSSAGQSAVALRGTHMVASRS
jgi:AcrR family transcriptional regulator